MVFRLRQAIALLLIVFTLGLASCGGDRDVPVVLLGDGDSTPTAKPIIGAISEVSPPERIQQLKPYLDVYEPQVRIVSPRSDETLESTTVSVELQVRDFPIYKDQDLGLGPHLHLFLDEQPYRAVYDTSEPIVFEDLSPGTHTLRVFASRPWHESFKNAGAYDQVTFNVFTESPDNNPDDSQALLTYSRPQGSYGAEPIMLDFYLTNAPLHIVAQDDETITDWRIRCTVNGESFVFDRWQPIYLKGFKPGKNWVKLELIDENGNLIDNAFNTGIRVIEYTPGGDDGLAQLIRGEIPLAQAKVLVDPNYEPPTPVIPKESTPETPETEKESPEAEMPVEEGPVEEVPPAIEPEVTPPERETLPEEPTGAEAETDAQAEESIESTAPTPETIPEAEEEAPSTPVVPTPQEPTAKPKQQTPMPTPEPTAEPGMLPEIIEETKRPEPERAPEPQPETNPAIAPSTKTAPTDTPESTAQPPGGSEEKPLVVPDAVEEVAPPSEPKASPVPETTNSLESRRQKRQRSRFSRDRLLRRNSPEPEPEQAVIPEAQPQSPVAPPSLETEKPEGSLNSAENSPQAETAAPSEESSESSSTMTDGQPLKSTTEAEASEKSGNLLEADESALESLEEESDVI